MLTRFAKNRAYVEAILNRKKLNALLLPLNAGGGPNYNIKQVNTWRAPVSSNSGLPSITIIGGYTQDNKPMPVGLELIGKMYHEGEIIALAHAYASHYPTHLSPNLISDENSSTFAHLTIPEFNNLLTQIGYNSYHHFLQDADKQQIDAIAFARFIQQAFGKDKKTIVHTGAVDFLAKKNR